MLMSVIEPVFFSWKERILDIMIGVDQFEFGYSRIVEIRKKNDCYSRLFADNRNFVFPRKAIVFFLFRFISSRVIIVGSTLECRWTDREENQFIVKTHTDNEGKAGTKRWTQSLEFILKGF